MSYYQQWIDSQGLDKDDVSILGLRLVSPADTGVLLGYTVSSGVALLPYPNEEYYRVRRLGTIPKGEAKYLSPKGSGCSPPYLPPFISVDAWLDIRADVKVPIVITEGEVKAYWGCKTGGNVVGIGGVEMQDTLFDGRWEWRGRAVVVCFDHDEGQAGGTYKPGVHNALGKLCSRLAEAGAQVGILHIGLVEGIDLSRKWGLDDYFRSGGTWADLIATQSEPEEWCAQLAELLDTCAYVVGTNHTHIYNLLNHSRKSVGDFHDAHIDKVRVVMAVKADGTPYPKREQVSRQWISHPHRVTVDNYTLDPTLDFGVQNGLINLWKGYPTWAGVARREDVRAEWQRFMQGLFGEHWRWVGLWTAHLLNRPEERCTQAIMLITMVQGIGKSLYGDIVRDLCGEHGLESSSARMFSGFNAMEEGKTFVVVNELDVKFNAKEGQLNDLLTEETVKIEQKGKDVIVLPNLRRWYLTSNTSSPCRLSKGQRRVFVIHPPRVVSDTRGEWGQWVREVVAKFRKDDGALASIRDWFDELWWQSGEGEGVWDSTAPVPQTIEGDEAAEASMTGSQILARAMYDYMVEVLDGWGAIHPELRSSNAKVWGEVSALVKAHGGYCMTKLVKREGRVHHYSVFDVSGKLPRKQRNDGGYTVDIESANVMEKSQKMAEEWVRVSDLLPK
jgi:hypothetical protein